MDKEEKEEEDEKKEKEEKEEKEDNEVIQDDKSVENKLKQAQSNEDLEREPDCRKSDH